ncbi:hypothetical protein P4O66_002040 [Electrophorus voltai]|uniref:Uncharacterized protein n=1 Tax=Electrophorus voltai TaxID=2609070 RepID=A0AAD9DS20_9TELE|nr:hypothetical protein P4O66_002040 [Electrophorus voltai]
MKQRESADTELDVRGGAWKELQQARGGESAAGGASGGSSAGGGAGVDSSMQFSTRPASAEPAYLGTWQQNTDTNLLFRMSQQRLQRLGH